MTYVDCSTTLEITVWDEQIKKDNGWLFLFLTVQACLSVSFSPKTTTVSRTQKPDFRCHSSSVLENVGFFQSTSKIYRNIKLNTIAGKTAGEGLLYWLKIISYSRLLETYFETSKRQRSYFTKKNFHLRKTTVFRDIGTGYTYEEDYHLCIHHHKTPQITHILPILAYGVK